MKTNPKSDLKPCLNCGLKSNINYCPSCGQSMTVHIINFKETITDFLSSSFSLQGPFFYTLNMLIFHPGKMLVEFLAGKRIVYYKPVSFFVLTTVVYLLLRSLIDYDPLAGESFEQSSTHPVELQRMMEASRFMVTNINNVMLFLVLAMALCQKLFFYTKYNLAEYTSIAFYVAGVYTFIGTFMMLIIQFIYPIPKQAQLLFLVLYIIYVMRSLFGSNRFLAITKYGLVAVLTLTLYIIFGFGFSYLMVSIK